jgi:hypothetical protein
MTRFLVYGTNINHERTWCIVQAANHDAARLEALATYPNLRILGTIPL